MEIVNEFQPNYCKVDLDKKTPRDVIWIKAKTMDELLILQKISKRYKLPIKDSCIILDIYQNEIID